jgi:hypothetical protein
VHELPAPDRNLLGLESADDQRTGFASTNPSSLLIRPWKMRNRCEITLALLISFSAFLG